MIPFQGEVIAVSITSLEDLVARVAQIDDMILKLDQSGEELEQSTEVGSPDPTTVALAADLTFKQEELQRTRSDLVKATSLPRDSSASVYAGSLAEQDELAALTKQFKTLSSELSETKSRHQALAASEVHRRQEALREHTRTLTAHLDQLRSDFRAVDGDGAFLAKSESEKCAQVQLDTGIETENLRRSLEDRMAHRLQARQALKKALDEGRIAVMEEVAVRMRKDNELTSLGNQLKWVRSDIVRVQGELAESEEVARDLRKSCQDKDGKIASIKAERRKNELSSKLDELVVQRDAETRQRYSHEIATLHMALIKLAQDQTEVHAMSVRLEKLANQATRRKDDLAIQLRIKTGEFKALLKLKENITRAIHACFSNIHNDDEFETSFGQLLQLAK